MPTSSNNQVFELAIPLSALLGGYAEYDRKKVVYGAGGGWEELRATRRRLPNIR